jgi:hypothetical protein
MERNSNFGHSSSVKSLKKEDYLNNAQKFFFCLQEVQTVIALLVKTLSNGLRDCGCTRVEGQEIFLFCTDQTVGPG